MNTSKSLDVYHLHSCQSRQAWAPHANEPFPCDCGLGQAIVEAVEGEKRKARLAVLQLILNTCKYEGRELYLSRGAVENLLQDLRANDDSHKALTALKKLEDSKAIKEWQNHGE